MKELYNLELSIDEIKNMIEICPHIKNISEEDIKQKIIYLQEINCSNEQIANIIYVNPLYFDKTNEEIIFLINKLYKLGFETLNILFEENPYILNLETYEIDNYINSKLNNKENLKNIIDDLDSNPLLFNEI